MVRVVPRIHGGRGLGLVRKLLRVDPPPRDAVVSLLGPRVRLYQIIGTAFQILQLRVSDRLSAARGSGGHVEAFLVDRDGSGQLELGGPTRAALNFLSPRLPSRELEGSSGKDRKSVTVTDPFCSFRQPKIKEGTICKKRRKS